MNSEWLKNREISTLYDQNLIIILWNLFQFFDIHCLTSRIGPYFDSLRLICIKCNCRFQSYSIPLVKLTTLWQCDIEQLKLNMSHFDGKLETFWCSFDFDKKQRFFSLLSTMFWKRNYFPIIWWFQGYQRSIHLVLHLGWSICQGLWHGYILLDLQLFQRRRVYYYAYLGLHQNGKWTGSRNCRVPISNSSTYIFRIDIKTVWKKMELFSNSLYFEYGTGCLISRCFFLVWYFGYLERYYNAQIGLKLTTTKWHLIKYIVKNSRFRQNITIIQNV